MAKTLIGASVRYSPLFFVVIAWEISVRSGLVSPTVLPKFSTVIVALWHLAGTFQFLGDVWTSIYQTAIGFGLAVLFGVALGVGMARIRAAELALHSIVTLWYSVPVIALFPLLAFVLKLGDQLQISIILLGSVLPVIVASFNAARGVDHYLVWSALNMGTSRHRVLWKIVIPAAMPEILSGIRVTLALSFVLMVASEQLGATGGLGSFTLIAGENGFYSGMFAGILVVATMGFLADRLYLVLIQHLLRWQEDL